MNKKEFAFLGLVTITMLYLTASCGRRVNDKECRTRESMQLECQVTNTPNYGRPYAQEMCSRNYTSNRCY